MISGNVKISDEVLQNFSFEDYVRIGIEPIFIAHIAWMYAERVVKYSAKFRINEVKQLSRTISILREQYKDSLLKKLSVNQIFNIEKQIDKFVELNKQDFTILYFSTSNAINFQYKNIEYYELRTLAYLSMQFIRLCKDHEDDMTDLIISKIGKARKYHLPVLDKLYDCMDAYLGDYSISEIEATKLSIIVIKRKIENIEFKMIP